MMATSPNLKKMYFGVASAEAEVANDPEQFLNTYFDRWGLAESMDKKGHFLILGPKGAGKSAIGEFTRLTLMRTHGEHSVFSRTLNLDEVSPSLSPLSTITSKLASDQAVGITDSAWRLFLAIRFFELLQLDQSCSFNRDPQIQRLIADLNSAGLTRQDFPTVLRRVRENKTTLNLAGILGHEWTSKQSETLPVSSLGDALIQLICQAESDNHFLLTIDGLDRIIGDNDAYWLTLAALLRVGDALHNKLKTAHADIRLLVMCRSDVFRKIRFADSDKIAGDSSIFVDWAAHQTVPTDSPLWDYLGKKARISPTRLLELLPSQVIVGERTGNPKKIHTPEYLLQSTRSTPREMTMLMRRVQEESADGGYIDSKGVRRAVDNFATRDLLTIVGAEATGMIGRNLADRMEDILASLPGAANVRQEDLDEAALRAGLTSDEARKLGEFLFLAGLLGNFSESTGHIQFSHRRDTYKFNRKGPWVLHKALMYAFNLPYLAKASSCG